MMECTVQSGTTAAQKAEKKMKLLVFKVLACAACAAVAWGGLYWWKNKEAKNYISDVVTNAKAVFNALSATVQDAENGKEALLPADDYLAYCKLDGNTVTLLKDSVSAEPVVFSLSYFSSESPLYFCYRMENGVVMHVSVCWSKAAWDAPETGRNYHDGNDGLTMKEFYFDKLVAYYPEKDL